MNERQRKILGDAFGLLMAGARKGKRLAGEATYTEVRAHLREMGLMVGEMERTLDLAQGAGSVLEHVANKRRLA